MSFCKGCSRFCSSYEECQKCGECSRNCECKGERNTLVACSDCGESPIMCRCGANKQWDWFWNA